jgi:GT2 family glycosyltransferase
MKLVVFVLSYRSAGHIRGGSLDRIVEAANEVPGSRVPVVVLDNYGCDGSLNLILERHRDLDVLMAPRNLFYCDGVNAGLRYIFKRYNPDFYILCDADNYVEPGTFSKLADRAMRDTDAGIVQPLVKGRSTEALYSCGHFYNELFQCRPMSQLPPEPDILTRLPSCSILTTLFRKEVFINCGILDPIFKIYYESSDIGFRARQQGWRCVCETQAVAYHDGSDALGPEKFHMRYFINRNWLIFWSMHDREKYERVSSWQQRTLEDLERRFAADDYGLGEQEEAIRAGIRDGLLAAETSSTSSRTVEHIGAYDKSQCILIRGAEWNS